MNGIYSGAIRDFPSHPHLVAAALLGIQKPAFCMQARGLCRIISTMHRAPAVT